MKLTIDFSDYQPWGGALEAYNTISDADRWDDVEAFLEDIYPDGMSETELNDMLWFEPDTIYEAIGIETEEMRKVFKDEDMQVRAIADHIDTILSIDPDKEEKLGGMEEIARKVRDAFGDVIDYKIAHNRYGEMYLEADTDLSSDVAIETFIDEMN